MSPRNRRKPRSRGSSAAMAESLAARLRELPADPREERRAVAELLREELRTWQQKPAFATAILKRLARAGSASVAHHVLAIMTSESIEVNSIHYNAALAACDTKTWQGAGTLLANMRHRLLLQDIFTYSSILGTYKEKWDAALRIFAEMRSKLRPDAALCNGAAGAMRWLEALEIPRQMRMQHLRPDVITFSTISLESWPAAMALLQHTQAQQLQLDRQLFGSISRALPWQRGAAALSALAWRHLAADGANRATALGAAAKATCWEWCLGRLGRVGISGHNTVLSALRGRWALALDRVRWMETRALRPDQVSRNVLSNALPRWRLALFHADLEAYSGAGAPWRHSLALLARGAGLVPAAPWRRALQLWACRLQPEQVAFSALLSACGSAGQWPTARGLLAAARLEDLDEVSFGAAISACAAGRQWQLALALLQDMLRLSVAPNRVAINAAASACERGGRWRRAGAVLGSLAEARSGPDAVSFNVALSAAQKAQFWRLPCLLLERMGLQSHSDAISFDTAILACSNGLRWPEAVAVLQLQTRRVWSSDAVHCIVTACNAALCAEAASRLLLDFASSQRMEKWQENQWVKMGAHHTLEVELNNKLTLGKDRWDAMHLQELDDATDVHKTSEAGLNDVGRLGAAALGRAAKKALAEGQLGEERWASYASRAAELAPELSFDEAARFASAFSTARYVEFPLFAKLSARALECLQNRPDGDPEAEDKISAAQLRSLAVACGRANAFDGQLLEAMVPFIEDRVESFRPRELVHIADAYARLPVPSPELFSLVAEAMPPYLYDLKPPELASLCRSYAEVAMYNEELQDAIGAEVAKRVSSFGAMDCVTFLDALSRLHEGMEEDLRAVRKERDAAVVAAVAEQLGRSASSLQAADLVRAFAALVRLDHYNSRLVHGRICAAIALKMDQLQQVSLGPFSRPPQAPRGFSGLAELLRCLSLLPAQSHKSVELTEVSIQSMTQMLAQMLQMSQEEQERRGVSAGRDATASVGRLPEPRAVAMAAAALAQLGRLEEDLLMLLGRSVGARGAMLALCSEEELEELKGAFELCGEGGADARQVLAKDVHRVSVALPRKRATTTNYDKALVRFFEQVYQGIKDHVNLDLVKCVLLAGPGFVKDDYLSWMIQRATQSGRWSQAMQSML
ncbi:unnamed protein product [Effrenium voratum]|nr:unnamed protein product [Effrenium voratum]